MELSLFKREPVRIFIYAALTIGVGAAVAYGLLSGEQGALIGSALALALGVPAAELARASVIPVAKLAGPAD